MSKFLITAGKGFQLTFENGWTVSVQFGKHNYCENRESLSREVVKKGESQDAEIAAFPEEGLWYDFGSDTVKGYCSADEVAQFIAMIQALPSCLL